MSPHFCKVGKIKPNFNALLSLKELESKIAYFVEDTSKFDYSEGFAKNL